MNIVADEIASALAQRPALPTAVFGYSFGECGPAPMIRCRPRVSGRKIAFEELLRRLPPFKRIDKSEWLQYLGLRGLKSLRLRLEARSD